jgi:hypothetical protein
MSNHKGAQGFLSRMSREDAFLMFEKFKSEDAELWCIGELFGWDFDLTGKVEELSRSRVRLVSLDGKASVSVWLDRDDLSFWYTEPSAFPSEVVKAIPKDARDAAFIGVLLPLEVRFSPPGEEELVKRDKLLFAELKGRGGEIE